MKDGWMFEGQLMGLACWFWGVAVGLGPSNRVRAPRLPIPFIRRFQESKPPSWEFKVTPPPKATPPRNKGLIRPY